VRFQFVLTKTMHSSQLLSLVLSAVGQLAVAQTPLPNTLVPPTALLQSITFSGSGCRTNEFIATSALADIKDGIIRFPSGAFDLSKGGKAPDYKSCQLQLSLGGMPVNTQFSLISASGSNYLRLEDNASLALSLTYFSADDLTRVSTFI
jgi:hypothetical protein